MASVLSWRGRMWRGPPPSTLRRGKRGGATKMANGRWQIANYRRECTKVTIIPLISLRIFRIGRLRHNGTGQGNYESYVNSRNPTPNFFAEETQREYRWPAVFRCPAGTVEVWFEFDSDDARRIEIAAGLRDHFRLAAGRCRKSLRRQCRSDTAKSSHSGDKCGAVAHPYPRGLQSRASCVPDWNGDARG